MINSGNAQEVLYGKTLFVQAFNVKPFFYFCTDELTIFFDIDIEWANHFNSPYLTSAHLHSVR